MPLTNEERFQKERDQILALIAELMVFRSNEDHQDYPQNMRPALNALDDFKLNAEFQDNITAAEQAITAAINDVMANALGELASVATEMSPLGAEMAGAREVAERGERELILPRIAVVSATALSSLQSLLKSVKELNEADLSDSTSAIEETIAKLKEVIEKLPNA